ncbi:NAD(P)-dependent oxidoreductase [Nocardia sp. NBC_00881]|uniref:NAD(P)-dependent oxidoreductase n=1 Tax=Nocardia sp. NBC_00881 TaxID=2975995 RepID=UPI003866C980
MRLAVLGASGALGRRVVARAVSDGHSVRVLVRDPAAFPLFDQRLVTVVVGDALDPDAVQAVVTGSDAVISALGSPGIDYSVVRRTGAVHALDAMRRSGITRFVTVSITAVKPGLNPIGWVIATVLRNVLRDVRAMESVVCPSDADWVVIRAPRLTDEPSTGRYRLSTSGLPSGGMRISRADLAEVMVARATAPGRARTVYSVSY